MAPDEQEARLRVSVAYSPRAGEVDEVEVSLSPGATVADALRQSGLQARHPGLDLAAAALGVWGSLCRRDAALRDRDRVEVYRPLVVDPKETRRQRQRDHRGAKRAKVGP